MKLIFKFEFIVKMKQTFDTKLKQRSKGFRFFKKEHTYQFEQRELVSVTKFIEQYRKIGTEYYIAKKYKLSPDDIEDYFLKDEWEKKRKLMAERGNLIHKMIKKYMIKKCDIPEEYKHIKKYIDDNILKIGRMF
jgi:hypothetical protein